MLFFSTAGTIKDGRIALMCQMVAFVPYCTKNFVKCEGTKNTTFLSLKWKKNEIF